MKTFEPCQQTLFDETELQLTLSAEAFPAKTFHTLENELALKVRALVSGQSMPDLLAKFDRASQSWKTSQVSLVQGMDEFSETWPRSGMMLSGIAYQLPPSAPLTGGTGSGLLPTPTSTANQLAPSMQKHPGCRLLWPTPRASEFKGTGPVGSKSHAHRLKKGYLDATVLQFPTPRAQSARGSGPSRVGNKADLQTVVGGSLNADWVEWLMGFPIGWTQVPGFRNPKTSRVSSEAKSTAPTD